MAAADPGWATDRHALRQALSPDAPDTAEVRGWVVQFATFNELAAAGDGYHVVS